MINTSVCLFVPVLCAWHRAAVQWMLAENEEKQHRKSRYGSGGPRAGVGGVDQIVFCPQQARKNRLRDKWQERGVLGGMKPL